MGSWGVAIFSNDAAEDAREDFRELIAGGMSADDATQRLTDEHGIKPDGADDNDFWLGLAATQHRLGHVSPQVVERALAIIADPNELARWDLKDRTRRASALEKLRLQLIQPAPEPKRVRPRKKVTTDLQAGQHVVFEVPIAGPVLLRIEGVQEDKGGQYPQAIAVQWDGSERSLKRADRLPPHRDPDTQRLFAASARALEGEALGFLLTGGDPSALRLLPKRVGRKTPTLRWSSSWVTPWTELTRWFLDSANVRTPWEAPEP